MVDSVYQKVYTYPVTPVSKQVAFRFTRDLLRRIDKFAVIVLGSWWIHSSSIIMWTLLRTVQTADYATYMGWALPIIAKMFAPSSPPPPQEPPVA